MNRTTQSDAENTDWGLLAERSFFWGMLLVVAAVFYSAFGLTTTSMAIPTAGIVRVAAPAAPAAPRIERAELARVLEAVDAHPCICTDSRSLR